MDEALEDIGASLERLGRQSIFQHDDAQARESVGDIGGAALFREGEGVPIPHDFGMAFDKIVEVHSIPKKTRGRDTRSVTEQVSGGTSFVAKGM
jgi:hypothetical protein